jgi:hypothetical protein
MLGVGLDTKNWRKCLRTSLTAALSVTTFITTIALEFGHTVMRLKSELNVQQTNKPTSDILKKA